MQRFTNTQATQTEGPNLERLEVALLNFDEDYQIKAIELNLLDHLRIVPNRIK